MKKLSVIVVMTLLLVAALIGCKTAENVVKQSTVDKNTYSYVDIDPVVIGRTWDEVARVPYDRFTVEMYFCNPDKNAPIQFATVFVTPAGVSAYSFMINGIINVCQFNAQINAYVSVWNDLTDMHRAQWQADYQEYFEIGGV